MVWTYVEENDVCDGVGRREEKIYGCNDSRHGDFGVTIEEVGDK